MKNKSAIHSNNNKIIYTLMIAFLISLLSQISATSTEEFKEDLDSFKFLPEINKNHVKRNLQTTLTCGNYKCPEEGGYCAGTYNQICVCYDEYDSYPFDKFEMCNYKRKKQIIAFVLELFLMFGIGHFYLANYKLAIIKLIFFILGYSLFIVLRKMSKKTEENNTFSLLTALFGCFICILIIIWQIIDVILLGLGRYTDGKGIEMSYMN